MRDISFETREDLSDGLISCPHHGDRNTLLVCPVCVGFARAVIDRYEKLVEIVTANAEETDYCIACDNHPSHGHSSDCLLVSPLV